MYRRAGSPNQTPRKEGSSQDGEQDNNRINNNQHNQQHSTAAESYITNLTPSGPIIHRDATALQEVPMDLSTLTTPQSTNQMAVPQNELNGLLPNVPDLFEFEGKYGFDIKFTQANKGKSVWCVSDLTKKLYSTIEKDVPFEIVLSKNNDSVIMKEEDLYIRALLTYTEHQHLYDRVIRCPFHVLKDNAPSHGHVVVSRHPLAEHHQNEHQLSAVVPLDNLRSDQPSTKIIRFFHFKCFASCKGGISRRQVAVVFTLENRQGQVYGRKLVNVRLCAAPLRDRKVDDDKYMLLQNKENPKIEQEKKEEEEEEEEEEEKEEEEDDNNKYTIEVYGQDVHQFMLSVICCYYSYLHKN